MSERASSPSDPRFSSEPVSFVRGRAADPSDTAAANGPDRVSIGTDRGSIASSNSLRPSFWPAPATVEASDPWQEYVSRIAEAPETGTVRGLYFSEIMRLAPWLRGTARRRYVPFSKYPLREFMQLLVDAGRQAHPSKSPHEALRLLGMTTYSTFASSMAGVSLLSSVSIDIERILELTPHIYPLAIEPARIEIAHRAPGEAIIQLRDVWTFPESYQVGVWLGGMSFVGVDGTIDVIRHGWCNVDFHLRWTRNNRS